MIDSCDWDNLFWVLLGDLIEETSRLNEVGLNWGDILSSFFSGFSSKLSDIFLSDFFELFSDISDISYSLIPSFSFSNELSLISFGFDFFFIFFGFGMIISYSLFFSLFLDFFFGFFFLSFLIITSCSIISSSNSFSFISFFSSKSFFSSFSILFWVFWSGLYSKFISFVCWFIISFSCISFFSLSTSKDVIFFSVKFFDLLMLSLSNCFLFCSDEFFLYLFPSKINFLFLTLLLILIILLFILWLLLFISSVLTFDFIFFIFIFFPESIISFNLFNSLFNILISSSSSSSLLFLLSFDEYFSNKLLFSRISWVFFK